MLRLGTKLSLAEMRVRAYTSKSWTQSVRECLKRKVFIWDKVWCAELLEPGMLCLSTREALERDTSPTLKASQCSYTLNTLVTSSTLRVWIARQGGWTRIPTRRVWAGHREHEWTIGQIRSPLPPPLPSSQFSFSPSSSFSCSSSSYTTRATPLCDMLCAHTSSILV